MIKLSLTAMADFMTSSPHVQRKTLFDYKFPEEEESKARQKYYREARNNIRSYHDNSKPSEWLERQSSVLAEQAALNPRPQAKSRLKNNARTLLSYAHHYECDLIKLISPFKGELTFGKVVIGVNPDLHGIEKKKQKVIRLDYGKAIPEAKYCAILAQLMYESAGSAGLELPTSAFIVRHIESKTDFAPARKGAVLMRDIVATCENIEGIWATLAPHANPS